MKMKKCEEVVCVLILIQLCSGIYIKVPSTKEPVHKMECPYDCFCNFQQSYIACDNGFSLLSLTDRTFMYRLKTVSIKRLEEVLLRVRFDQFTNLENLDLSSNVISTVPESSFRLNTKLTNLKLRNNYIHSFGASTFSTLRSLSSLDLSHNNIHSLDSPLFNTLNNLEYLNISKNALTNLPLGLFTMLKRLKVLDLSSNNIVYLTTEMLFGLSALKTLNISRNNLVTISNDVTLLSDRFVNFIVTKNNLDCSCELKPLIERISKNPLKYGNPEELICNNTFKLVEMENQTLPCTPPEVTFISNSSDILARRSVLLRCKSMNDSRAINYWKTPSGTFFSHENVRLVLKSYNVTTTSYAYYKGCNLGRGAKVSIQDDGALYIDSMRGFLAGKFTCVAVNGVGSTNSSVDVGIYEAITDVKYMSLFICAGCSFLFFMIGVVMGSISLCVQKCSCCCSCCQCCSCAPAEDKLEDGIEEDDEACKFTVEDIDEIERQKLSTLESCNSNDSYYSYEPPDTPFNSPTEQTPRSSPRKCPTPSVDFSDKSRSPNIKDTLDEVKVRLEKKMIKVRGHYHSIKESGSVYLTNIKDSGKHAANKVTAGVVIGMEQVKYGVKSIKEFCGTGDMGSQTISAVSFSTNVDTEMTTREVKTTTTV